MAHIVERVSVTYPDLGEIRKKVVIENEASSFGLLKENLIVRVLDETSREQRLQIQNAMMSVNEDITMVIADAIGMMEDMKANLKMIDFFSVCTSVICFILGMF